MYIPKINLEDNEEVLLAFMQRYSFATIVNSKDNQPVATHLPFTVQRVDNQIKLVSHFAKANQQWQLVESGLSLVIFTEPHAYISPSHYEKGQNVPTWNYIAVHAYGKGTLIIGEDNVRALLEQTIHTFESGYIHQWNSLTEDFKRKMALGIVAFEITITELQGKKKLSQNKSVTEQKSIITALAASNNSAERDIADYMQHHLDKHN